MRRHLLLALGATALLGIGVAAYRTGKAYSPEDPVGGFAKFADTVKKGAAQRERDLRDALGLDVGVTQEQSARDARGGVAVEPTREPLTEGQARDLLLDPTGPDPRPVTEGSDG